MLKYAQLQLDENGFIANSHEVLKLFNANNRSYETMGIRLDGAAYGLVYDSESEILWHNGGTSNYNAYLAFSVKDNIAVAVLSNLAPGEKIPATVLERKILGELLEDEA